MVDILPHWSSAFLSLHENVCERMEVLNMRKLLLTLLIVAILLLLIVFLMALFVTLPTLRLFLALLLVLLHLRVLRKSKSDICPLLERR